MVDALDRLGRASVPHAPVNGVIATLTAPSVAAQGCVQEVASPEGTYRVATTPLRGDGVRLRPAPRAGEHTDAVLARVLGRDPQ